ncbi:hypothetical protein DFH09DRAFT_1341025 [Mycena vulgaris]|nr:hypothetical protein DFH09DRAFT_1341025 [Mycena vulgaris]
MCGGPLPTSATSVPGSFVCAFPCPCPRALRLPRARPPDYGEMPTALGNYPERLMCVVALAKFGLLLSSTHSAPVFSSPAAPFVPDPPPPDFYRLLLRFGRLSPPAFCFFPLSTPSSPFYSDSLFFPLYFVAPVPAPLFSVRLVPVGVAQNKAQPYQETNYTQPNFSSVSRKAILGVTPLPYASDGPLFFIACILLPTHWARHIASVPPALLFCFLFALPASHSSHSLLLCSSSHASFPAHRARRIDPAPYSPFLHRAYCSPVHVLAILLPLALSHTRPPLSLLSSLPYPRRPIEAAFLPLPAACARRCGCGVAAVKCRGGEVG